MEFSSADRSSDAEYSAGLKDYNTHVSEYNKSLTTQKLTDETTATGLQSDETSSAAVNALKQAGQHATAIAGAVKTATDISKASAPLKATAEIAEVGGDVAGASKGFLGKVAGKASGILGVVGDVGSIGLDIAQDKANWGKMSTMDKIANVADMGGAGLDMVGTGLMAFGGPLGMVAGEGIKLFGDLTEVAAGTESAVSGAAAVSGKQADIGTAEKAQESALGPDMTKTNATASEAGSGTLAVARQSQL